MLDYQKGNQITEAQIYYTRTCNSRCGFCNIPDTGIKYDIQEIKLKQWETLFLNLEQLGIKTVKLLGGEPTEKIDLNPLLKLIRFVKKNTNIKLALLSNSKWDKAKWFDKFCSSGLFGYYASIDAVEGETTCHDTLEKSQKGYQVLLDLQKDGSIPLLAANIVISKKNIKQIPKLAKLLSDKGFYINICPLQCFDNQPTYNNKKIEYHFRKKKTRIELSSEDKQEIKKVVEELVFLQKKRC